MQVLAISETHLRADKQYDLPPVDGYTPYSSERKGDAKGGGGLQILYKTGLSVHEYQPSVPDHLQYVMQERQWLLFGTGCRRLAFLHCYLACQTSRHNFLQWNEDLLFLMGQEANVLKQQGFLVFVLGDFNTRVGRLPGLSENTPDTNRNYPMFMNFIQETNLMIINTMPVSRGLFTWFGDKHGQPGNKSLLDYGLIDPDGARNVSSFVIDDKARFRVGGDHALLDCTLSFSESQPKIAWKYNDIVYYNITDGTNYQEYAKQLDSCISTISMAGFEKLSSSEMLQHLTSSINACALKTIGLKVAKKKRGRKLPLAIRKLIEEKNSLISQIASESNTPAETKCKQHRIQVFIDVYTKSCNTPTGASTDPKNFQHKFKHESDLN